MEEMQPDKRYTYADYASWDTDERYELIDGVPYLMAPPLRVHQAISSELHGQLWDFLRDKPCKVYAAPIGVRLNANSEDNTVVEPDIVVVCDPSKLDDKGIVGAPDLVIEITSPSSGRHDRLLKFDRYLRAGVREYWIVDPDTKTVSVNVLKNGEYVHRAYGDTIPVHVLDGCEISLSGVFPE